MAYFDEAQHKIVSDAVAQAELTTSGEIVPVIADRSDGYSDVVLVWAIAAAFTAMSIFAAFPDFFLDKVDWILGGWSSEHSYGEVLAWAVGFGLLKFLGVWLFLSWDPLRFFFTPGPVKRQRVHDRAVRHFKVGAEGRTHGKTGVLLYLSMQEHRAEIVADDSIAELVPAEVWGEAMADMLVEIRKGCIAEGIAAGVRDVGKILSEHFPRGHDDENELPDRLIEV
ncbi:TPM domain-containing protein [Erythrobacter alti]|uniref:TPM domain-containing protein n=1 Tax=Erythrobacter alti TaxID=1896145 RepID=UPI0030F43BD1